MRNQTDISAFKNILKTIPIGNLPKGQSPGRILSVFLFRRVVFQLQFLQSDHTVQVGVCTRRRTHRLLARRPSGSTLHRTDHYLMYVPMPNLWLCKFSFQERSQRFFLRYCLLKMKLGSERNINNRHSRLYQIIGLYVRSYYNIL